MKKKFLLVGDPHVTPDSLEECDKLFECILSTAIEQCAEKIILFGDLHHTHASIRVEVLHFYTKWLKKFAAQKDIVLLVGNHDMPGNATAPRDMHALLAYRDIDRVTVVDSATDRIDCGIGYMPYYHDPVKFVEDANNLNNIRSLFCHQTFIGAKYDNNFPAPDGADIDSVNVDKIVTGHHHTIQSLADGKIQYIGAPRWLTASDANKERGIWVATLDDTGVLVDLQMCKGLEYICRRIRSIEITPLNIDTPAMEEFFTTIIGEKLYLTFKGPTNWLRQHAVAYAESMTNVVVRAIDTSERKNIQVKESDGLAGSLKNYVHSKEWEIPKEHLWSEIEGRISWLKTA